MTLPHTLHIFTVAVCVLDKANKKHFFVPIYVSVRVLKKNKVCVCVFEKQAKNVCVSVCIACLSAVGMSLFGQI